jgi:precorrin-8X/cobalt-precorrin-8 methylmutase
VASTQTVTNQQPLFDSYVAVDWSAANRPKIGRDSIWWCVASRHARSISLARVENPATRSEAHEQLGELLRALLREGKRVLVGFDFPYGYPAGFAAVLGLRAPAWHSTWKLLRELIQDRPTNANNRFDVAEELNWLCPSA